MTWTFYGHILVYLMQEVEFRVQCGSAHLEVDFRRFLTWNACDAQEQWLWVRFVGLLRPENQRISRSNPMTCLGDAKVTDTLAPMSEAVYGWISDIKEKRSGRILAVVKTEPQLTSNYFPVEMAVKASVSSSSSSDALEKKGFCSKHFGSPWNSSACLCCCFYWKRIR